MDPSVEYPASVYTTLFILLILSLVYAYTMYRVMTRCSEENRRFKPWMAWLVIIPLFKYVWNFYLAIKVDESLQDEFQSRGISEEFLPTKKMGLAYAVVLLLPLIPPFKGLPIVVYVSWGVWLVYWWRIFNLSRRLAR